MTPEMEILVRECVKRGDKAYVTYDRVQKSLDGITMISSDDLQGALALAKASHDAPIEYALRRELLARQRAGQSIALRPSG